MTYQATIKMSRRAAEKAAYRVATGRDFNFGAARSAAKQILTSVLDHIDDCEPRDDGTRRYPVELLTAYADAEYAVATYRGMPANRTHGR